jgi:chromosomal replication initiation ATPase DnaA
LVSREGGVLTLQAPTRFIADWVESHYVRHIRAAWEALGHEITEVRFVIKGEVKAA